MVETLLDKVGGINLNGGHLKKEQYKNYLQSKTGYQNNINDYSDCDCIDCGDCDCSDCAV